MILDASQRVTTQLSRPDVSLLASKIIAWSMDLYWTLPKVKVDHLDEEEDSSSTTETEEASVCYSSQPSPTSPSFHCDEEKDDFELQQESQEIIGARRKGKKKGRKNKTKKERKNSTASQRQRRNARERTRIKNISLKYNELRWILGFDLTKQRFSKHKVLVAAIEYITKLKDLIKESTRDGLDLCNETSSSSSSSTDSTESASSVQPCSCHLCPYHANAGFIPVPFSYYGNGRCPTLTPSLCPPPHIS